MSAAPAITTRDGARLVFNFHGLGPPPAGEPPERVPYWCPVDRFAAMLDEMARQIEDRGARIEITFDDGYRSDVEIGLPALRARRLAATFFVCSDRIGAPGFVGVDDMTAMAEAGMGIGSHGAAHVDLRALGGAELAREAASRQVLEAATGRSVDTFAVPFGSYDRRVLAALGGYRRVYSSDGAPARDGMRPIPRYSVLADWDAGTIAGLCDARPTVVQRARAALYRRIKALR